MGVQEGNCRIRPPPRTPLLSPPRGVPSVCTGRGQASQSQPWNSTPSPGSPRPGLCRGCSARARTHTHTHTHTHVFPAQRCPSFPHPALPLNLHTCPQQGHPTEAPTRARAAHLFHFLKFPFGLDDVPLGHLDPALLPVCRALGRGLASRSHWSHLASGRNLLFCQSCFFTHISSSCVCPGLGPPHRQGLQLPVSFPPTPHSSQGYSEACFCPPRGEGAGPAWLCTHPPALFGLTPYQVDCEALGQGPSTNMSADGGMPPGRQSRSPAVSSARSSPCGRGSSWGHAYHTGLTSQLGRAWPSQLPDLT